MYKNHSGSVLFPLFRLMKARASLAETLRGKKLFRAGENWDCFDLDGPIKNLKYR